MKQGILITAYKDFKQLLNIIGFFDEHFLFFIHIDKKFNIPKNINQALTENPRVKLVSQKYYVNWGGRNHLLSILHLCKEGLKNKDVAYFHLITGQDYPIKSSEEFKRFFNEDSKNNYLENFTMPAPCWNNGGFDRILYYNPYDLFDYKKSKKLIHFLLKVQKKIGLKRTKPKTYPQLYGGSTYWSLYRDAIQFVVNFPDQKFLKRMKHTFCAEEIYFQTLLMNSKYAESVINSNLRYILWQEKHGSSPGFLDEEDFVSIVISDAFFARKFNEDISEKLRKKIELEINILP